MTNRQLVKFLHDIANLLEIKGENVFKVRAFARAADTLDSLSEEAAALREKDELRSLPGIGSGLADTIEELLDTGRCKYYDELLKNLPPTLLDILHIPEVGPKTVKQLYETLHITTVEELEAAAKSGSLRDLKGMGQKTEENILKGIERLRRFSERFSLSTAYPVAIQIVEALKENAPIKQIEIAGSLRRMRDTIGDLDILVTSTKPEEVMQVFIGLPMVTEVVASGPTKTSAITDANIEVDLRVVEPKSFGAALLYFTGSKNHNVKLRELAQKQNLTINEYSISDVKTEKAKGGKTEEEIYKLLGMEWIAPELREDTGEVEAALAGKLPQLIQVEDMRGDLHIHSNWSDGKNTIEEMAAAAIARGYEYMAFCDHSPAQPVANGLSVERLMERQKEIEKARKRFPDFLILAGTEVDIKADGSLDYPDEALEKLDFVIASVHSGWKASEEANTKRLIKAISHPLVDVIGHPTGRLIAQRDPYEVDMEAVLQAALSAGVAMEIDAHPDRLDLKDTHARRAKELSVKLMIDTDAHRIDNYDLMRFGVATARRGWVEAKDVLNTLPREKFLKALRSHKTRKTN